MEVTEYPYDCYPCSFRRAFGGFRVRIIRSEILAERERQFLCIRQTDLRDFGSGSGPGY